MTREEAKQLFRDDKDAYGKPRGIMKKIDMIYDDFEKEIDMIYNEIEKRKGVVIGSGGIGNTTIAMEIAKRAADMDIPIIDVKTTSPTTYEIKAQPKIDLPIIKMDKSVFNQKKHDKTCAKNRKKRKKKK